MYRKSIAFLGTLVCLLAACVQTTTPRPALPATLDRVPVTVIERAFAPSAPCTDQFVTHTLSFATGTRLRAINTYESNGAGLAVNDLDGDGDLDLVFASIDSESAILWNEGEWRFTVETLPARFTRSAAIVDVDGDGALDLVFTHRGLQTLSYWRNQGVAQAATRFIQTPLPGVDSYAYAMAWADLTGDGHLDLVTGSYNIDLQQQGLENPEADARAGIIVYEQQADGFVAQPLTPKAQALAIALVDLSGDRSPDIWVANDFDLQDRIWFQQAGAWEPAKPFDKTSYSTMGIEWGDITNTGYWAFYTTDMNPYDTSTYNLATWLPVIAELEINHKHEWGDPQVMANTLQVAQTNSNWREQGNISGVDATGWSWSSKFGDLDSDGFLDLYVVNGMIAENLFRHLPFGELVEENQVFRNRGDGTFAAMPTWQLGATASGRGMSMADLDNDGDLDIVVSNLRQPAQVFENQLCGGAALQVELRWPTSRNPYAIGAQLELQTSSGSLLRDVRVVSGYLSGDPVRVHFGFPVAATVEMLTIRWPDGATSQLATPAPGHLLEVTR
ncbi:MAG: CRTAC1 family protein [Caldilineaceae bacterium]|nr:CRTAC1 family protein [Caldilineaceae bacterium]